MKILLIADPMIPVPPIHYGGIERIIDMLCHGLTARNHIVGLVAHAESTAQARLYPFSATSPSKLASQLMNGWTVWRAIRKFRPQLIHSFGRLAFLWPVLRSRVPKIMSYQREPAIARIGRSFSLAADGTLAFTGCSDYITDQIRRVATAHTVYNGVPLARFAFQESVAEDAPLVFLGRIERIKGVHNAIAIAQMSARRLVLAGNVPDDATSRRYFATEIQPRLNERIRYIGPVDDLQKNKLLGKAAALIMAIEWNEPFGIVMAEALACGTPVIGTPRGAIPEVVKDGVTGFVRRSNAELAEAVQRLSLISRRACRSMCEQRFSDQAVLDGYLEIYEAMAKDANVQC